MAKGIKGNQVTSTMPGILSAGAVVSVVIMLAGASICATLILGGTIKESSVEYCAIAILLLSAIAGAATSVGKRGEKRLYIGMAVGMIELLVLLSVTAVFFGGRYEGVLVAAMSIFGGCILAVLLTQKRGMIPKSHRSKNRRR